MLRGDHEIVVRRLSDAPDAAIVFASQCDGAALLDGWSDEAGWRVLLPWPDEIRQLSWDQAPLWSREFAAIERDVAVDDHAMRDFGASEDDDGIGVDILRSPPFLGGWVGFICYEAAATEEAVRRRADDPPELPFFFARHRAGVVVDPAGAAFLFAPAGDEEQYVRRLEEWRAARAAADDRSAHGRGGANGGHGARVQPDRSEVSSERRQGSAAAVGDSLGGGAHRGAVERIRAAILDGDVYQVNLTRTFSVARACDAAELYRTLTGSVPPRMSAFVRAPGCTIVSASPEVLLRFDRTTGVAETRPIKGTVRRNGDDADEVAALLGSAKDAAEHLMIVDVARNDLGKVAAAGNVAVSDYRRVRTLEYVHHLESTVCATGLRDSSAAEILAALSPAASITGAPKRAAVEMIREVEPTARGVYCGSVGFIGSRFVELSVAIRTAIVTANETRYHAGGGIVWDSDADAEDDESRAKSTAFLRFAGATE